MQEKIEVGFRPPPQIEELLKKHKAGYSWFFWIAGLSLVNTAVVLSGAEWSFIIGLGFTQLIDGIALAVIEEGGSDLKTIAMGVAVVFDVIAAATFVLWGVLAKKGFGWAYIVGIIAYGLDTLWFLLAVDVLSIGFHIFATVMIIKGFMACKELTRIKDNMDPTDSPVDIEPPPETALT